MTNVYNFEAEVHMPLKDSYRVKLSEHNIGMFINGMVVYPPNDKNKDWGVLTPSIRLGRGFIRPFEFNGKKPMWLEIKEACINAVKLYLGDNGIGHQAKSYTAPSGDTVLLDIEEGPIDLSEIPF